MLHLIFQLFTVTHNHEDRKSSDRSEETEEDSLSLSSMELTNISHRSATEQAISRRK